MAQKKRGLKDKPHESTPMRLIFQQCHLLRELAPLLTNQPVAGFHRARPSTTLDKASIQFTQYYTPVLPKVKLKQYGGAGGGGRPPSSLARRCVRPVLAPAQAWVRAGAGLRGGALSARGFASGSRPALRGWRFAFGIRSALHFLLERFASSSRLTLRFWRVLHRCALLRFYRSVLPQFMPGDAFLLGCFASVHA